LTVQRFWYILISNSLSETLYYCTFSHTGLPHQHRVVFCPPGENLNTSSNLIISADDRIKLSVLRKLQEIYGIFIECFVTRLGIV